MQFEYKNKKIKKLCNDYTEQQKRYGNDADKLVKMLQYLEAAPHLQAVSTSPPSRRHKLSGEFENCFAVDINFKNGMRIVFQAYSPQENNLEKIDTIVIIFIGNYH